MTEPDASLVARVQSGDAAAFEILMRRYFRMVFIVAYAQLNDRADAEDACQDVFLRCWEHIGECRDPARVGAWIATIARNTARNRRAFLRLRATEPIDDGARFVSPLRADSAAERNDLRARLGTALQRLSPIQREVVLLHDLEGWKHAEIAARLDLSEVMSRRHLSDARKHLRSLLGELLAPEQDHD